MVVEQSSFIIIQCRQDPTGRSISFFVILRHTSDGFSQQDNYVLPRTIIGFKVSNDCRLLLLVRFVTGWLQKYIGLINIINGEAKPIDYEIDYEINQPDIFYNLSKNKPNKCFVFLWIFIRKKRWSTQIHVKVA